MVFFMTFSSDHPLRDGWIKVQGKDEKEVREKIFKHIGPKWAFLYTEESFERDHFPRGEIGEIP